MEQWEIDLRAKLDLEVPDGAYDISTPGMVAWTGKGGYINYLVELQRYAQGLESFLSNKHNESNTTYGTLTEQDLRDFMDELRKNNDKQGI